MPLINKHVNEHFRQSYRSTQSIWNSSSDVLAVSDIANLITDKLIAGRKLLICGNGGSAADAQHFAAELTGRFLRSERPALPAIALTTDTSAITAIGNDFGFDEIFARQIEALARPYDVLIAISTSGKSPNIIRALTVARDMSMHTVGFTALSKDSPMPGLCDHLYAPNVQTSALIQQAHIMAIHAVCAAIDRET